MLRNHRKPTFIELRERFYKAPDDALIPRMEVAAGLNISRNWLEQQAIRGGFVPYVNIGRHAMYRKSEVMAWLAANGRRVVSTSDWKVAAR